ncbi:MAG: hypothetical protein KIT84_42735 [Labilithrix sp.]|nr:hypothetical protein [Labilithrix sp.]MCW5817795.1 hypothetical protein [Labilithrix sp.]
MASRTSAALLFVLFGCDYSYTKEEEDSIQIAMEDLGGCPSEDLVEREERAVDVDRTTWSRQDLTPLCFYRLEGVKRNRPGEQTFEELRANALEELTPGRTGGRLATKPFDPEETLLRTADLGVVYVLQSPGPECPQPSDVEKATGRATTELLESVARSTYRLCDYEVTREVTRRPFACGNSGVFSPP